jgi:hypothetical protein
MMFVRIKKSFRRLRTGFRVRGSARIVYRGSARIVHVFVKIFFIAKTSYTYTMNY